MPDITLCTNTECPMAGSCKRALLEPSDMMQSYHNFKYDEHSGCEFYWEVDGVEEEDDA